MAEYDPPIYDVSIFNPAYFLDEDEITKSYLRANFLEFPIGQGLETLPDLRVENTNIHLGTDAGLTDQRERSIAIGNSAGKTTQLRDSVAIGYRAAETNQGTDCVAIGIDAGKINQGNQSICIGKRAGESTCGSSSISIGNISRSAGANSVAIGNGANTNIAQRSIAIGYEADAFGTESIAIGDAATTSTYTNSVAIGNGATATSSNEVKLSDKASFIGSATQGWVFGDLGTGLSGFAGIQNINYARDGTKYALLQNATTGTTSVGAPAQLNLNVGNTLRAYITDCLRINTAGIAYNGTTLPSGTASNQIGFRWRGSSAEVGVAVDNVLSAYFAFLSDRRGKRNIVDYTDGLTGIMKLKPKQYEILKIDVANCDLTGDNCIIRDLSGNTIEYDSEGNCCDNTETYGELNTGLILDEVRPIFPQVCVGGDENSIGTINYAGLVPHLVKAVQQQQEQIEALKLEVEALKNP
jgi:hypothetical protein